MLNAGKALALVLTLLAAGPVFANCTDNYVADCGDFKILSTVCSSFDLKGRPTGGTESFSALFEGEAIGKVSAVAKVFNDVAIYSIQVSDTRTVVVNFSSQILKDMKRQSTYSTYDIVNELKTRRRNCDVVN